MKKIDIQNKVKIAVKHSVPDVLDSILSDCEKQKRNVIPVNTRYRKKRNWAKPIATMAAVFALLLVGITGYGIYGVNAVDSVISFDVNPSIEMTVNKNERVLQVKPLNNDAQIVIGEMDFKNTDLEVAINALIGSMLKNGYIDDIQNSILISVENPDEAKEAALQAKLGEEIARLLQASSIDGAILSQSLTDDDSLTMLADENDITRGRAQLIRQLVNTNANYKFEDLAKLSINELNLLIESKDLILENASSVGTASDKAYIGMEKAGEIALEHAGVSASDIKEIERELDFDDGRLVYEVEFKAKGMEYEYEIDASSGQVLSFDKEKDDDYQDKDGDQSRDDDHDKDDDQDQDDDDRFDDRDD